MTWRAINMPGPAHRNSSFLHVGAQKMKAKLESNSSYFSFKRRNQALLKGV
jgi:hypothetical protein